MVGILGGATVQTTLLLIITFLINWQLLVLYFFFSLNFYITFVFKFLISSAFTGERGSPENFCRMITGRTYWSEVVSSWMNGLLLACCRVLVSVCFVYNTLKFWASLWLIQRWSYLKLCVSVNTLWCMFVFNY